MSRTEVGADYYGHAVRGIEEMELAEASAIDTAGSTTTLRVTMSPVLSRMVVSPLIAEFPQDHPGIRISLDLTERHSDVVCEGFDIAIRATDLEDFSLKARCLSSNPLMLAALDDYLKPHGEPPVPDELSDHSCLSFTRFSAPLVWCLLEWTNYLINPELPTLAVQRENPSRLQ